MQKKSVRNKKNNYIRLNLNNNQKSNNNNINFINRSVIIKEQIHFIYFCQIIYIKMEKSKKDMKLI